MDPLFDSGPVWIVVPDVEGAEGLRAYFLLEQAEMEVELGGKIVVADDPPPGMPALRIEIDDSVLVPHLIREQPSRICVRGQTLDACESALSLLRTMRRTGATELGWEPTQGPHESIKLVDAEVATTWPSFGRTGIDWADLGSRARPDGADIGDGGSDGVAGLQRWVAQLGDGHTNVHVRADVAALPYAAQVVGGQLIVADVPVDTPAWNAGIRAEDEILDIDIDDIARRAGAPPQLKPWLVGRRALSGPVGVPLQYRVRRPDGSIRLFEDTPGESTWPHPIQWQRLSTGTLHLRIRRWHDADEAFIDRALNELRPGERVRWSGRTRFLTDGLTYSASEDAILGLSQLPNIDIVGRPSGGGSGRARRIALHGTEVLTVSTALTYDHLGRCIEGDGIAVDLRLPVDQVTPRHADQEW